MALDFAAIITRPNVVHKQRVKHNTFKLYIRNERLEIKIIRSLNYFLLLKLNVGSELSYNVADRSRRRRRKNQAVAGRPIPKTAAQVTGLHGD